MLEKELEKKFKDKVKAAGGRAYKFTSPGNDGVPDRLVVMPGGHIGFVELKQKGKKPTKLQTKQMNRLKDLGCFVCMLDNPEAIDAVIFGIEQCTGESHDLVLDILEAGGLI